MVLLMTMNIVITVPKINNRYLMLDNEENKHLKGFWFKPISKKTLKINDVTYELILEERRNENSWEKATKYFFCLYCKKTENNKIEYLDIRYKNFGRNESVSFENMVKNFDKYKFPTHPTTIC